MVEFFLVWVLHSLGWFSLAALCAVLRGLGGAMHIKTAIALGLVSSTFHVLLVTKFLH